MIAAYRYIQHNTLVTSQDILQIHKGGSTQDLNNFHRISLLSMFDKIIGKIIHTRLYAFLETHNILYEKQFGFRKNNSTIFA